MRHFFKGQFSSVQFSRSVVSTLCDPLIAARQASLGNPLRYSCLENPMDGGAWWAAVHGVARSRTWLSDFTFTFHFHALEKEMATHSSVISWRIPGTGEPRGLPSMGSHKVRHDWSDLAAAAAGLPVHHQLLGFTQTHVHQVGDAIQPSHPLLFPSPPAPNPSQHQSFPMSQIFAWGGQSIGVSALASVLPMNTQDWSPSEWTGWISLQSKGLSRVFSNTTVQKHQFFGAQISKDIQHTNDQ